MDDVDGTSTQAPHADRRLLAREAIAAALYLALVLLGALVALPSDRFPEDADMVKLLFGTAIGLVLAHWLAFRLASQVTHVGGLWSAAAAREAIAQIAGALPVALLAALPFWLLDGVTAIWTTLGILAALPALTELAIGRLNGWSWPRAVSLSMVTFMVAAVVVVIKASVAH